MKKFARYCFACLLMSIVLSSCHSTEKTAVDESGVLEKQDDSQSIIDNSNRNGSKNEIKKEISDEESNYNENKSEQVEEYSGTGQMSSLVFYDYFFYQEFCKYTELPSDFVYYEKIKDLGEFRALLFYSDALNSKDYSEYFYGFEEEEDRHISLVIRKEAKWTDEDIEVPDKTDLRRIEDDTRGVYTYNGIEYFYLQGGLCIIRWEIDGLVYSLSCSPHLWEYPYDKETVVSLFLNTETACQALEYFR